MPSLRFLLVLCFIGVSPKIMAHGSDDTPPIYGPEKPPYWHAVKTLGEQFEMYQEAYAPCTTWAFQGKEETQHIAGLAPLAKMGFTHAAGTLSSLYVDEVSSEADAALNARLGKAVDDLYSLWESKQGDIRENLTLQNYNLLMRDLALLMTDREKIADHYLVEYPYMKATHPNMTIQEFIASSSRRDMSKVHAYPFCFMMTLFHENAELPMDIFIQALLAPATSSITCLAPAVGNHGQGVHGNHITGAISVMHHDYAHWEEFVDMFGRSPHEWPIYKEIIGTLVDAWSTGDASAQIFKKVMTYMLCREDLILGSRGLASDNQADNRLEGMTVRQVFNHWIENAKKVADNLFFSKWYLFRFYTEMSGVGNFFELDRACTPKLITGTDKERVYQHGAFDQMDEYVNLMLQITPTDDPNQMMVKLKGVFDVSQNSLMYEALPPEIFAPVMVPSFHYRESFQTDDFHKLMKVALELDDAYKFGSLDHMLWVMVDAIGRFGKEMSPLMPETSVDNLIHAEKTRKVTEVVAAKKAELTAAEVTQ